MFILSAVFCLAMTAAGYVALPLLGTSTLPVHWNGRGQADSFAAAATVAYAFPVVAAVLSAAFALAVPGASTAAGKGRRPSVGHMLVWAATLTLLALLQVWMLRTALR
jgi:uncharacterized membrane protein